ncbi:hypothetical protein QBC33DRAFT_599931 [Phialemonium atrogriseum]|uniref:Heterokaryon incompatibility domain-containing protein n=1 Tax=Phialemonium atrogriseum TaxID=1093897 RepID=A0AAJ0BQR6_9PEZI|nr:uncharacterized protein QBC33DRAFT_599931 [Phialemonium atrogriseum]KAK1762744.1 hypothetical protein QBC33DRAFT_599931 [Phialemonium atrogriseum]
MGLNGLPPPDSRAWGSLFHLFNRPWFSRIWSSKKYTSTSALRDMSKYFTQTRLNIINMRGDHFGRQNQPPHSLLDGGKRFDATDPRDKVYVLMNFPAFCREALDLVPDYSATVQAVYADATEASIRHSQSLHILTCVDRDPENHRPDTKPNLSSVCNVLHLLGFELDTIADVCEIVSPGSAATSSAAKPAVFTPSAPWEPYIVPGDGPYPTEAAVVAAYVMTLTAGCREHDGVFALHCAPEMVPAQFVEFVAWLQRLRGGSGVDGGGDDAAGSPYPPGLYSESRPFLPEVASADVNALAAHFRTMVGAYTVGRCLFRTRKGYLGLGSHEPQSGDLVCIFFGGAVPFLLRRRDGGSGYELVGDAYVHGVMQGETGDMWLRGETECQTFDLR